MLTTSNYGLKKPEGTDVVDIQNFNDNADIIDVKLKALNDSVSDLIYSTAIGTATAITLTLPTLVNGYAKTFIAAYSNSGAATTINGKPLYKPGTTTAPNLIAGKAYTVWYNSTGSCFFIKASAEGTTIAAHVLAGDTFSNDLDTGLPGTMANNGAVTITPGTTNKPIPIGYHNGSGYVLGDADLVSANIKSGANIFGVAGSSTVVDTSDASLDPQYLLSGQSGYDDGVKKAGTMVNQANYTNALSYGTYTDGDSTTIYSRIPKGAYLTAGGSGYPEILTDLPNLISQNIVNGVNIAGVVGTATAQSLGGLSKVASGSCTGGSVNNLNYGTLSTTLFSGATFVKGTVTITHTNGGTSTLNFFVVLNGSNWLVFYYGTNGTLYQQNTTGTSLFIFYIPSSSSGYIAASSYVATYNAYN